MLGSASIWILLKIEKYNRRFLEYIEYKKFGYYGIVEQDGIPTSISVLYGAVAKR